MARLPIILEDWIRDTEQHAMARERGISLSDSHLLAEAEWCLYNCYENDASGSFDYSPQAKAGLKRWVMRMKAKGVKARHDFDW